MEENKTACLSKRQQNLLKLKFFLFSISAGVIQLVSTTLLNTVFSLDQYTRLDEWLGNDYGLSYFIGLTLSVLWNFTLNRRYTFKSAASLPVAMLKILGFYCVFAPLSIWWTVAFTEAGVHWLIVQLGTMLVNLTTEYLFCRFVVYRNSIYTNKAGRQELKDGREQGLLP
jgi:putative flippase GtrA